MTDTNRTSGTPRPGAPLAAAATFIAFAAIIAVDASHLQSSAMETGIGAKAFPFAIAAGLAVIGLMTAWKAFRTEAPNAGVPERRPLLLLLVGLVLQVVLLDTVGFIVATGLMFGLAARAFGARSLPLAIIVGIGLAAVSYFVFRFGLDLTLPEGALERLL